MTTNLDEVFQTTFKLDSELSRNMPSAIFFLANGKGDLVTTKKVNMSTSSATLILETVAKYLNNERLPYSNEDYLIEATPVTLDQWNGYFGVAVNSKEVNKEILHSILLSFKQNLIITTHLLDKMEKIKKLEKRNFSDHLLTSVLKETNYTVDVDVFLAAFLVKIKAFVGVGECTLMIINQSEDRLVPRYSTAIDTLQDYIIPTSSISEAVNMLASNAEVITKTYPIPLGIDCLNELYEDYVFIPLKQEGKLVLSLLYGTSEGEIVSTLFPHIEVILQGMHVIYKLYNYEKVLNEQKRQELLLNVTKKFHSSMDVSEILGDILDALKQVFPSFEVQLLLSHEWDVSDELPILQLSYSKDHTNEVATNAYLTGKIQIEDIIRDRKSIVYAPLRGKQGVYGVLKIMASDSFMFPQHEITFIEVLADTGGNAIENAELYQQSRQLVEDLQLINRTSHELNSNLRLSETISYMTKQIKLSFQAQEIGFFMFRSNGNIEVIEGSTSYFLNNVYLPEVESICMRIRNDSDSLFIGDLSSQDPYLLKPFRSFIGVPMVQSGELIGAVLIVHDQPYRFSFNEFKLLQSLIHHSTLAFTNSMLHEELENLVITDHLTRLYARNYLDDKIQESMKKDAYGCFLLIDIDDFKKINDVYGHQVGDDIIIQVANILKRSIKNTDIAARWGGEELAVYLPKVDQAVGSLVAERIRKRVSRETAPAVTISCGISDWKHTSTDTSLKTLFNRADKALYSAKRTGKNNIVSFDRKSCYL